MSEHVLKCPEPYFTAVKEGHKTFEARPNDRAFQTGDVLVLLDPESRHSECGETCGARLNGSIRRVVTFVFSGDPSLRDLGGVVPGYVILALAPEGVQ